MGWNDDYIDVPSRIIEFRTKHPDGSFQSEIVASPFDGFVVVKAYAYRTPDDPRPGTGTRVGAGPRQDELHTGQRVPERGDERDRQGDYRVRRSRCEEGHGKR
jgi:hypothetical protein